MLKLPALAVLLAAIAPVVVSAATVRLPYNTTVSVQVEKPISSQTARAGDEVPMHVAQDVLVNGYVLIARGAKVAADVESVTPSQMHGGAGLMKIACRWAQAVDGSKIGLTGGYSGQGSVNTSFREGQDQSDNASQAALEQGQYKVAETLTRMGRIFGRGEAASHGGEAQLDPNGTVDAAVRNPQGVAIASYQRSASTDTNTTTSVARQKEDLGVK